MSYADIAASSNLDSRLQDAIRDLARRRRGALVKMSTDLTAQNLTAYTTPVPFDTEVYDTDGLHDNTTDNTRLTVPTGWTWVRLTGMVYLNLNSAISNYATTTFFRKNGTDVTFVGNGRHLNQSVGNTQLCAFSGALSVTAGDYFEMIGGASADTSVTIKADTWFEMELLA